VQGYRNGAFSQIKENPGPASLGLHSVKGRASTQVVSEGGADSDTMIFQRLEAGCVGDFPHFLEGLGFGPLSKTRIPHELFRGHRGNLYGV
jgi:hypothetical protein